MIRNIIFDMGNVLVAYTPEKTLREMGVSEDDIQFLMREVFSSFEWVEMDRGTLSKPEAFEIMKPRLPRYLADFVFENTIANSIMDRMPPFPEMYDLVCEIKKAGYPVYLLSNASPDFYVFSKRYPVMDLMDGKIVSADYKVVKPERELYQILFDTFSLKPEECFFVDDLERNIEGAKAAGMDGICFSPSFEPVSVLRAALKNVIDF